MMAINACLCGGITLIFLSFSGRNGGKSGTSYTLCIKHYIIKQMMVLPLHLMVVYMTNNVLCDVILVSMLIAARFPDILAGSKKGNIYPLSGSLA